MVVKAHELELSQKTLGKKLQYVRHLAEVLIAQNTSNGQILSCLFKLN